MSVDSHFPEQPAHPPSGSLENGKVVPLDVDLARVSGLKAARERGLVLAAAGITHLIGPDGAFWVLRVAKGDAERALAELNAYETEELSRQEDCTAAEPEARWSPAVDVYWGLLVVAFCVVGAAVLQAECGAEWVEAGIMSAQQVLVAGEWWRIFTALTLHGDVPHVVVNLGVGLVFGGLLARSLGSGIAWFAILLSGAGGNVLTALAYFPEEHRSLGASTAVFGALGLLVGDALGQLIRRARRRSWWTWILPMGAGVSLLAYLGGGEGRGAVDVLAHLSGFLVGLPLGFGLAVLRPLERVSSSARRISGILAFACLVLAWETALRHRF